MGNVQNCDSGADHLTAIYDPIGLHDLLGG
jgi:hypothetical protein